MIEKEDLEVKWTVGKRLTYLDFAEGIALLAGNYEDLQRLILKLEEAASTVALRMSNEKTNVTYMGTTNNMTPMKVGTQLTKEVEQFTYLEHLIAKDGNTELDINSRIGKAAAMFRGMNKIWKASKISTQVPTIQFCGTANCSVSKWDLEKHSESGQETGYLQSEMLA